MALRYRLAVVGLALDSRAVQPGGLFLALSGEKTDGRDYVNDAVRRGATAVVYEARGDRDPPELPVPAFGVANLKMLVGRIADRFFGAPSRQLYVIGVTGTNGKTTCAHLIAQALDAPDARCGVIGTVGNGFPDALNATTHTTPDAVSLHRMLAEFVRAGARYVCMEVSSHGLEQGRVEGVAFDLAVFTNLSHDHLDYHGDMAAYAATKARLFDTPELKHAVINCEDDYGATLAATVRARVPTTTYGLARGDVHAIAVAPDLDGLGLRCATPRGEFSTHAPLFGRFNAANLLAVAAALLVAGLAPAAIGQRLAHARAVAGRMERFGGGDTPMVVVDYAHTPDALEKVLLALREHTGARLYCVFGCGGDRDRGKRPRMGEAAERLADVVVITDDNPRHEPPQAIVAEILAGTRTQPRVIHERRAAIGWALAQARAGDIVLVAGKGHEDYQQVGDRRLPYSDRATVSALLGKAA